MDVGDLSLWKLVGGPFLSALAGVLSAAWSLWRAWARHQEATNKRLDALATDLLLLTRDIEHLREHFDTRIDDLRRTLPKRANDTHG